MNPSLAFWPWGHERGDAVSKLVQHGECPVAEVFRAAAVLWADAGKPFAGLGEHRRREPGRLLILMGGGGEQAQGHLLGHRDAGNEALENGVGVVGHCGSPAELYSAFVAWSQSSATQLGEGGVQGRGGEAASEDAVSHAGSVADAAAPVIAKGTEDFA